MPLDAFPDADTQTAREILGPMQPPSNRHLGGDVVGYDASTKRLRFSFEAREEFLNPAGIIQGGILAAMCDDTMGPLVMLTLQGRKFPSTTDLHTVYLRAVKPGGRVEVEAVIEKMGASIAYTTAELFDQKGRRCVRAIQTAKLLDIKGAQA